jgi:hypothetical protein
MNSGIAALMHPTLAPAVERTLGKQKAPSRRSSQCLSTIFSSRMPG